MTPDDLALDPHASALEAATAVLTRYWPEGTLPPDPELLAARMGIEVVVGRPAGDAAVTAVRDERGPRVVLGASLHPSVRSSLLLRAIGHLSRPAAAATGFVTDEFTRDFAGALRPPGVGRTPPRPHAQGPASGRRERPDGVATAVGRSPGRSWTATPAEHPAEVDAELSAGVVAYLRRPPGPFRGLQHPDEVAAVAVHRPPERLLEEVRSVVREADRAPLADARGDFAAEIRLVSAHLETCHPELSREARAVIVDRWAFANR